MGTWYKYLLSYKITCVELDTYLTYFAYGMSGVSGVSNLDIYKSPMVPL